MLTYTKKIIFILAMSCVVFSNTVQPTQDQIDQMLHSAFQIIWEEAMKAKTAINQISTTTREELLDNLSASAPRVQFITQADISDSLSVAENTSASVFVSTNNQDSWIENANVAVVPGSAFGAKGHIRLSFATSMELLKEAVNRIKGVLN